MCGLVGVMGDITLQEKKVFNELLILDVLRGKHSTGVASIDHLGNAEVFKKAVNSMDFLDFNGYSDMLKWGSNCLLGHNRYATKGAVNNVNAHPFDFDNVVGMHNGTLRNYTQLDDAKDFEVDSECLYSHLSDNTIQDTIDKITGAYALTWFDKTTNKLHFLRNDERPLTYCFSEDNGTLFWASEPWMLHAALGRNGVKYGTVYEVTKDTLYSFDVPKVYATANLKLGKPKTEVVKKTHVVKKQSNTSNIQSITSGNKSKGPVYSDYTKYIDKVVEFAVDRKTTDGNKTYYIGGYLIDDPKITVRMYVGMNGELDKFIEDNRDWGNFTALVKRASTHMGGSYLLVDLRTVDFKETIGLAPNTTSEGEVVVSGYNGSSLNEQQFRHATRKGCVWCGDPVEFKEGIKFLSFDEYVCCGCASQEEVMEYLQDGFFGD